ncbi:MAG: DUF3859 domain-containing protein [Pseudanabaenaceae cyanobacterium SKYGB_i_bin29]|nr:DUF3859 domain-containing protein [Pseudanabaenaceae cyanobacterium SKYG29]MDW8421324.1 DUF3859 domain-containing protein [Pseudanabaenaceae cyanobacterium SKYGB_i_bin29]
MAEYIDPQQLNQVIAEIQKISSQREGSITVDQAREILRDMNLPDELLEEAILQVKRREAQKSQTLVNFLVIVGALLVVGIGIGGTFLFRRGQEAAIANVSSQASRVTIGSNKDQAVQVVNRPNEVVYRVTLTNAPIGQKLPMGCDWLNPQGTVVHQNRYQTKEVNKSIWNTQCKYQLSTSDSPGIWRVKMYVKGREVSSSTFEVR